MSRFLITCWPFVGHLYPQISVALALRARGHEVAVYSHPSVRAVVEDAGFRLFPFVHVDERRYERIHALEAEVPITQPKAQTLSVAMKAYSDMLAASIPEQVADLEPILEDWQPDVLITDPALWGPILVVWERFGIPVALLTQMIGSMVPGPDAPPWGPGLPPPRTFATRLLARTAEVVVDVVASNLRRQVNAIRKTYGLGPMFRSINAHTGRLPLYLIPSVPELDYNRRDQPANVHYVGPCVWTKPAGGDEPDWLPRLDRRLPWVHATEGTAQYQQPFLLRAASEALGGGSMEVVLTTGRNREPKALGLDSLPSHVWATQWLSHEDFLPKCAALITTGGAATVLASLKAGVPLVIVPLFGTRTTTRKELWRLEQESGSLLGNAPQPGCGPRCNDC